jgi:alpha,alpha-trehalose phosphorylase
MLHHERLRPPSHDYPPDEWNIIEKAFHPEFLAQLETMLALGNGYLGMRGGPEEGGPNAEVGTFINGFYETRPIVYGEEAYGFAKTGQTICNVTDSKIIKLFVDDEPFWLPNAHLLKYDRRLNMKPGMDDFWSRSDVRIKDIREDRIKRSTVEIQQAIRFNLFHILQASARAEETGFQPEA